MAGILSITITKKFNNRTKIYINYRQQTLLNFSELTMKTWTSEDSTDLQRCDAASLGKWTRFVTTFSILLSSIDFQAQRQYTPLKFRDPSSNAMLRHVPEGRRPPLHCYENLIPDMDKCVHTSLTETCTTPSKHNSQPLASPPLESSLLFFRRQPFLFFFFFFFFV